MHRLYEMLDAAADSCVRQPNDVPGLLQKALREATALHAVALWRDIAQTVEVETAAVTRLAYERPSEPTVLPHIRAVQRRIRGFLRSDPPRD